MQHTYMCIKHVQIGLRARAYREIALAMEKLLDYRALSESTGLPVRTLRSLTYKGVIPHIRLGHRLVRFQPSKVEKALQKREVREVR